MLCLSRKKEETIVVDLSQLTPAQLLRMQECGEALLKFTVIDVRGDKVRIGCIAAKEVPIHRNEVYESIRRNGTQRDAG
jgi:sRNA-binding carbon storage regulator CsrA